MLFKTKSMCSHFMHVSERIINQMELLSPRESSYQAKLISLSKEDYDSHDSFGFLLLALSIFKRESVIIFIEKA